MGTLTQEIKKRVSKKPKFYSLDKILEFNAQYNVIFGERSNGKTYAVLHLGLKNYIETGKQLAIVRRWQDDFKGKRGATMFDALLANGVITDLSGGKWNGITYQSYRWFLCRFNEDGTKETDPQPFAYAFAISAMEHDKSTSYPNVTTICFDEFLTRSLYLPDEFVLFTNIVSTIVRHRDDVKIFMLGNTVNKFSPYFAEMGLTNVQKMKEGTIDLYTYGESGLKVAVEYTTNGAGKKQSDVYFAFNNPKLKMITEGAWELDIYPHCPHKFRPKDVIFTYFIEFNGNLLQCQVIAVDDLMFTFITRKTTELRHPKTDIIFSPEPSARPNWFRRITVTADPKIKKLYYFFLVEKVFYQDNEVGDIVDNYIKWCKTI